MAFSANTNRSYASYRRSYLAFCLRYGFEPVPATTETIIKYAASLASRLKYGSIKNYMGIIRLMHLEFGLSNPLKENFRYNQVMRGIRRALGDAPQSKRPITPDILRGIRSNLNVNNVIDACVWAASCTLFYGMLRKASLLPSTSNQTEGFIRRQDVSIHPWGLSIKVSTTKTIQYGERHFTVFLPAKDDEPELCPARAVLKAMSLVEGPADAPLFLITPRCPLIGSAFVARMREALPPDQVGERRDVSGHSFRRGMATYLHSRGVSPLVIMRLGDWKSTSWMTYVDVDIAPLRATVQAAVRLL